MGYPADTAGPYPSPQAPSTVTGAVYGLRPLTPMPLDLSDVFSRAWTIFKSQMGICVVAMLIVLVIAVGLQGVQNVLLRVVGHVTRDEPTVLAFAFCGGVAISLIMTWIGIGETLFFLKVARGHPASFGDLFQGAPWLLTGFVASLLVDLAVLVGLVLCIVPGIIFALMFSQFLFLIVDRNAGIIDSLGLSKRLTDGNKLTLLGVYLLTLLINIGGVLACCIGIFFTAPFTAVLSAVVYLALTGQPTADMQHGPGFPPLPGAGPATAGPPGGATPS